MEPWEIAAREGIRALVARYNAAGDRGRIDVMVELFCDDAVLELPGEPPYQGRAAIAAFFEGIAAGSRRDAQGDDGPGHLHHHLATHDIEIEGADRARGSCYFQVLTRTGLDHWGRYVDSYRRSEDHWRFARRRVHVDGRAPGGWAERREAERAAPKPR